MKNDYFITGKHKYMQQGGRLFAEYIYSLIKDPSFSNYSTAVELGAGMGRFSPPVALHFSNVTLVEPARSYADYLRDIFSTTDVHVVSTKAEQFLADYVTGGPIIVFCFHLMHHLKYEQREAVYQFVKRTGSKCVFVEPNPFNLLILIHILLHPDMSLSEEIQYVTLTHRKYRKEFEKNGLFLSSYRRICFFPPFATGFLLKILPRRVVFFFEAFNKILPFLSSYHLITCEEADS